MTKQQFEFVAQQVFQSALEVHKHLGPGLLESVYEHSLIKELRSRNLQVSHQKKVPLYYKNSDTGKDFFIDILVEDEVIIEVKAVDVMHPVHEAQLISYLKLAGKKLGFLINFNVVLLKDGFRRKVNNY